MKLSDLKLDKVYTVTKGNDTFEVDDLFWIDSKDTALFNITAGCWLGKNDARKEIKEVEVIENNDYVIMEHRVFKRESLLTALGIGNKD